MTTPTHAFERPVIRIFVVDDHTMVRRGLAAMIGVESDMCFVGEASHGTEALALIPALAPEVVLIDLLMPDMDGIAVMAALRPQVPDTRFVVLTSQVDPDAVKRAMDAGAMGYLMKTASAHELASVIRHACQGHRMLAPEATEALVMAHQRRQLGGDLTVRERQVLALMTEGLSNQDIAERAGISIPTVKFHVTNIFGKLQVDNRTEAVLKALSNRLVPPRALG